MGGRRARGGGRGAGGGGCGRGGGAWGGRVAGGGCRVDARRAGVSSSSVSVGLAHCSYVDKLGVWDASYPESSTAVMGRHENWAGLVPGSPLSRQARRGGSVLQPLEVSPSPPTPWPQGDHQGWQAVRVTDPERLIERGQEYRDCRHHPSSLLRAFPSNSEIFLVA